MADVKGMNNQEVNMHRSTDLIAHSKALEAAGIAIQLFDEVRTLTWRLLHPTSRDESTRKTTCGGTCGV